MAYDKLFVDFCSSKVVLIVEDSSGKLPTHFSVESFDPDTVKDGEIYNLEKTAQMIRKALNSAVDGAKVDFQEVYVGFSSPKVEFISSTGLAACGTPENPEEITQRHIENAIKSATAVKLEEGSRIVQVIPLEYTVDHKSGIKHPEGMLGVRLEVKTGLVTASKSTLLNYKKALEKAGIVSTDFFYQPISLISLLTEEEKEDGTLFIDIGRDLTNYVLVSEGKILGAKTLLLGGNLLNNDLKYYLGIPLKMAEDIKIEHGRIMLDEKEKNEKVLIDYKTSRPKQVTKGDIASYMEDRLKEIFETIKEDLDYDPFRRPFYSVKLTGGTSEIENIDKLAGDIFGVNAEIYTPIDEVLDVLEKINIDFNPKLASAVGLYIYSKSEGKKSVAGESFSADLGLKSIFKKIFSK